MRHYISFLVLVMAVAVSACSDQFLKEAPSIVEISTDTIFIQPRQLQDSTITITTGLVPNSTFTIYQYPVFLIFDKMVGQFSNGAANITYQTTPVIEYFYINKQLTGLLIIKVDGHGLVAYPVQLRLPKENLIFYDIEFSSSDINIGEADSVVLSITNKCPATTSWAIYDKPDWISVESTYGSIESGQTASLVFKVNRSWLRAGNYKGTMDININSCQNFHQKISFSMDVVNVLDNPSKYNIQLLDGDVVAADFIKENNELLVLTSSPNRLTCFNLDNKSQSVIELTKKPTCMAVSENGEMALIGYTFAELSSVNLIEHKINRLYDLPFIPFDVEFGGNGWCYVSSKDDLLGSSIASIDLEMGLTVYKKDIYMVRGMTLLKKVPYREMILGIPKNTFPSKPRIADITDYSITNDFKEYLLGDLDTNGDLWFLKNGAYGICKNGRIFKFNFDLPFEEQIVYFGGSGYPTDLNHLYENSLGNKAALSSGPNSLIEKNGSVKIIGLEEFSDIEIIHPTPVIGNTLFIEYAFFNRSGNSLLMLIKRDQDNVMSDDKWHIETRALN